MIPIPLRSEYNTTDFQSTKTIEDFILLSACALQLWIFNCVGLCKLICVMTGECPRGQWVVTGVQRPVSDLKMEREDPVWVS